MLFFPANELTTKQNYKFLTGSIIPRPIAWITTRNEETSVVNAAPFSYFNVVAKDLPLVSLSINRKSTEMKDTAANLLRQREGVIHIVNDELLHEMNQSAASLPPNESELTGTNLTLIDSQAVSVPAIKAAPIYFEVRLHQYVPITGNDEKIISDLFILEVLNYHISEGLFDQEKEYIDALKLNPLARLAGNTYSHLSDLVDIKRPN